MHDSLQNTLRAQFGKIVFGASLSEPHTSVTSLRTCVCIYACLLACLLAWTDHLPEILNKRV